MKLSIVSIAYNNLAGLQKTLALFSDKRFADDIEIVVVDGASKDGSAAWLQTQDISKNWVSEPDKGIYNAMNKGLAMSHGDYVWFLNSGDYVEDASVIDSVLSALVDMPDAVYGETMIVDAEGKHLGIRSEISTRKLPHTLSWRSFRFGMNVGHQSFIIRRNLAVQYDESLKHVSDIDWMIRSLRNCRKIVNLGKVIACFTSDGYSTVNRKASNRERFKVLEKHYGALPNLLAHLYIALRKVFMPSRL
jgi:glycosyltransferase involved in cell wall biosynthesis